MIKTEPFMEGQAAADNAVEFEDYLPKFEKITFGHGENEKTIQIVLMNEKHAKIDSKTIGATAKIDEDDMENEQEEADTPNVTFKVRIEKAEPKSVKISKKNVCFVTINQSEEASDD